MSEEQTLASPTSQAPPDSVHVTIAICTYRRPALLERTLAGIALQSFGDDVRPNLDVVVVDNEGAARVRNIVKAFVAASGIAARCAIEPGPGISRARNAALELIPPGSDFVAFIDDDEVPSPGWLAALLATQRRTGAAAVYGPVLPAFEEAPPRWIIDGKFFHQPRRPLGACLDAEDGAAIVEASTNNALVRMVEVQRGGLRFHEGFGLTGGEDVLFFRDLARLGATMAWSPDAWVSEHVPAERARFGYLAREYFRCGNVRASIEALDAVEDGCAAARRRPAATRTAKKALKKFLSQAGLLAAALARGRCRARIYGHLFELANAMGRLASLSGYRYEHYR